MNPSSSSMQFQRLRSGAHAVYAACRALPYALSYFGSLQKVAAKVKSVFAEEGIRGVLRKAEAVYVAHGGRGRKYAETYTDGGFLRWKIPEDPAYMPKVSVIVPNYNHEQFLRQRLDSVYGQSWPNFEVILMDDCSTDGSREILKEYARRFPDITRCCFNDRNSGGVFNQWKKGLELASGELVWIAESDDWCQENLLAEQVPAFANPGVMLSFCRSDFVSDQSSERIWSLEEYLSDLNLTCWSSPFCTSAHWLVNNAWGIKNIVPNVSSAVFRHPGSMTLFKDSEWLRLRLCGDWIFYLSLVRGGLVHFTPRSTNFYRVHSASTSLNTQKQDAYYQEHEFVAKNLALLYRLEEGLLERQRQHLYMHWCLQRSPDRSAEFGQLYSIERARICESLRKPNLIISSYALVAGGGETFPLMLANIMHAEGYAVSLFNCKQEKTVPGVRNMLDRRVPLIEIDRLELVAPAFRNLGAEVVHSHHAWVDVMLTTMLSGCPEIGQVVTMHGMYEMMPRDNLERILPMLDRRVDRFVFTAAKNLPPFPQTFRDGKGFVQIDNALVSSPINPMSRAQLGIAPDAFVLCLVARGIPEKGWEEAMRSVQIARDGSRREIHLVIIGNGPEYERLRHQGGNAIHFLGYRENVRDWFAMSDMGFIPSRFAGESFPLVLIDCLYAGKPVLASNIGEIAQMLLGENGPAGELFDLADWNIPVETVAGIIAEVANDATRYAELARRVPAAAAKFDSALMAGKYDAVYQSCLRKNHAATA